MAQTDTAKTRSIKPDERCACGRRVTPLAKRLQSPNPGTPRKCFSCLVRDKEIQVVTL